MNAYKSVSRITREELIDHRSETLRHLKRSIQFELTARIYQRAIEAVTAWPWPVKAEDRDAYNACADAANLTKEALEDLIFDACQLHGIDRSELGELSEIASQIIGEA